ncbi:MAG TPA: DegT/DnrJ/EryC1/StrS family aminotransferase, partial [Bryobacteraceae bacterium]|nr:DegT/DnrJ/EryC1/StrS family aminotransferase [Bryobacteraceae bacterium]
RALIPVHLFGQTADMDPIMELARRHSLPVIEDAAQALGASYKGHAAGSIGSFGTYSFFPSKNLGGLGDSGLLVTNDDALAARARILRMHGMEPKYYHKYVGANFRMDALQAALLRVKLPHLKDYCAERRENAAYYTGHLGRVPGIADGSLIALPVACPDRDHIWNQYTLRVREGRRDSLQQFLREKAIGSEIYYPVPMHLQECFADAGAQSEHLPVCEALSREVLSIPIFPELTRDQQDYVIDAILAWLGDVQSKQ